LHLDLYNRIDIGLDTFPYNGTTTTCEALWMGVPVITLAGKTHAARVGASLLTNAGLEDMIAETQDKYRDIAVLLARDMNKLQVLRESLRERVAQSPLTDAQRFAAHLETCLRDIWRQWCETAQDSSNQPKVP
jgi:predicted O-linked N-acetylglucosamine transferase (SPINDLY family)